MTLFFVRYDPFGELDITHAWDLNEFLHAPPIVRIARAKLLDNFLSDELIVANIYKQASVLSNYRKLFGPYILKHNRAGYLQLQTALRKLDRKDRKLLLKQAKIDVC